MALDLKNLRKEYTQSALDMRSSADSPKEQFIQWFKEAQEVGVPEPNAMTLATVAPDGQPKARIVLLKQFDDRGFVFFTNYQSAKGQEIAVEPRASLLFWWIELQRQVRIEGVLEKIPAEESTAYFQSRPKGSQIGAWASPQSAVIPDRESLKDKVLELAAAYEKVDVLPRPEHWGGYVLRPILLEFWQGRASRLHDRILYRLENGEWIKERLAP